MATLQLRTLLHRIEQWSGDAREARGTDGQLLEDFAARADETAFAELVARHAPLVMRVCRRVLHHEQDAEDAFQATFLVLARCASSIRKREALADWLHGVAYRTAMKARRSAARRRNHEAQMRERTQSAASPTWDDVQGVLDEEIQRLPAPFRAAFVQCVLEGKTFAAAAVELHCKEGTVASRVARARQRLQTQLARRGIKLAALLAALCVAEGVSKAAVSGALCQTVIRNGLVVAAGGSVAGTIPPHVAALATGVRRAMFLHKAKFAVLVLFAVGLFVAGAGALTHQMLKAEETTADQPVSRLAADAPKSEETIEIAGRVLDPEGKPVAKARLYRELRLKETQVGSTETELIALGATDDEGRFRVKVPRTGDSIKHALQPLTPGAGGGGALPQNTLPRPRGTVRQAVTLIAAAHGFGLNWVELSKDEKNPDVTLRLVKDQTVRGRLLDTEGHPAAGVTVTVLGLGGPATDLLGALEEPGGKGSDKLWTMMGPLNKLVRVTASDKDGRFEITGAGADRIALLGCNSAGAVLPNLFVVVKDGFEPKKPKEGARQPQLQVFGPSFECVVLPSRPVEGTVRDAAGGKPVAGAEVTCHAGQQIAKAVTDDKGHYQLVGLPKVAKYRLQVIPPRDAPLLGRSAEAADRPGLERVTCDVELQPGVLVKGRVTDKVTGKGVDCLVQCWLLPDNKLADKPTKLISQFQPAYTDSEGYYSLVTVPGPNLLVINAAPNVGAGSGPGLNGYKSADLDEAARKRVKEDRRAGAGQHAIPIAGSRISPIIAERVNAVRVLDLESDGRPVTVNVALDPGKTLTIRLQDPDGKPLAGAQASGMAAIQNSAVQLKEDTCPLFALDPEHPRLLAFWHPERKLAATVTVRGDEKEPPTVRLAAPAVVTGRLLDADGKPVAGATIIALYREPAVQSLFGRLNRSPEALKTDKEGRFKLDAIAPGVKVHFLCHKDREDLIEEKETEREPFKAGATADLGDLRVKPRPRPMNP